MNVSATAIFVVFVGVTLGITAWAATYTRSRADFYTAGGHLTWLQNGIAFVGEFVSAATFLGMTGLYFTSGFDGFIYAIGAMVGWPALLLLFSGRLRQFGRYTLTDVLMHRFEWPPLRLYSAVATIIVLLLYMVGQFVGAGSLIELLFGINFAWAVSLVGLLMVTYVAFGGMLATTWIQIVKTCFLISLGLVLGLAVLVRYHFGLDGLLGAAIANHPLGDRLMVPNSLGSIGAVISVALTQIVGLCGLPHISMRFFTVADASEARRSATFATVVVGLFSLLLVVIGYGAIAVLAKDQTYIVAPAVLKNGNNMAPLFLARALGGDAFMGVCAAAVFATILAVVAGLALAVSAAVAHDIFGMVIRRGKQTEVEEIRVSRLSAVLFGAACIFLSLMFKNENITFLIVTALSIAASAMFPVLLLVCFWSRLTAAGALWGGISGLVTSLGAVTLGPTVWVAAFGFDHPVFPYQYPTIIALPAAFVVAAIVSMRQPAAKLAIVTPSQ